MMGYLKWLVDWLTANKLSIINVQKTNYIIFQKSKGQILDIKNHLRNQMDKFWKSKSIREIKGTNFGNQKAIQDIKRTNFGNQNTIREIKKPFKKSKGQILEIKKLFKKSNKREKNQNI